MENQQLIIIIGQITLHNYHRRFRTFGFFGKILNIFLLQLYFLGYCITLLLYVMLAETLPRLPRQNFLIELKKIQLYVNAPVCVANRAWRNTMQTETMQNKARFSTYLYWFSFNWLRDSYFSWENRFLNKKYLIFF